MHTIKEYTKTTAMSLRELNNWRVNENEKLSERQKNECVRQKKAFCTIFASMLVKTCEIVFYMHVINYLKLVNAILSYCFYDYLNLISRLKLSKNFTDCKLLLLH